MSTPLCDDYRAFVGEGTMLLLDTGLTIHAVQLEEPEQVGAGRALMLASDVRAWEVILNTENWKLGGPTVYCLTCDGDGCNDCRQRGWVAVDSERALRIFTCRDGEIGATRIRLLVDDCGIHLGEQSDESGVLSGLLVDRLRDIAERPHHSVDVASMLVAWEMQGLGKVLR